MRAREGGLVKGPGFSRIRAGMQARIPFIVPMANEPQSAYESHYRNFSTIIGVALRLATSKPGLQDLKREYNEVFEAFISGNDVFTALPNDSRKPSASLFSLWCLISYVETHPQRHCTSPLVADGRKDRVFTSLVPRP